MSTRRDCKSAESSSVKITSASAQSVHIMPPSGFEWDAAKAVINLKKHGVSFQEAMGVFEDDFAIVVEDNSTDEQTFVALGAGILRRILVVVYTYRLNNIRLISARISTPQERRMYEEVS